MKGKIHPKLITGLNSVGSVWFAFQKNISELFSNRASHKAFRVDVGQTFYNVQNKSRCKITSNMASDFTPMGF